MTLTYTRMPRLGTALAALFLLLVALPTSAQERSTRGSIKALGVSALTVENTSFAVTGQTTVVDLQTGLIRFSDLALGDTVTVVSRATAGTPVALRIERGRRPASPPPTLPPPTPSGFATAGRVSALTASSLTVSGVEIGVTDGTAVTGRGNPTFADVAVGDSVEVRGRIVEGRPVASSIRIGSPVGPGGPPGPGTPPVSTHVEGTITSLSERRITVQNTPFLITDSTRVFGTDGQPVDASALAIGQRAGVSGGYLRGRGELTALRIDVRISPGAATIRFRGEIEALGIAGLTVAGRAFGATDTTVVRDQRGAVVPFSDLAVGQDVEVTARVGADSSLTALRIDLRDRAQMTGDVELRGALDLTGDSIAVVLGRIFSITAATRVIGAIGARMALVDLEAGSPVDVRARLTPEGNLVTYSIEQVFGDASSVRLLGDVTAVADGSVQIYGIGFATQGARVFGADGPLKMTDVAVGQSVILTGARTTDGALVATEIRIRRMVEGEGRVLSALASAIEIPGLRVALSSGTTFVDAAGAVVDARSVTTGQTIRASGELTATGALAATRVIVTDEAVATAGTATPAALRLAVETVFPNPAADRATVRFSVAEAATVRLTLVDALGRTVATLTDGPVSGGVHTEALDTSRLAAGVYVVRLSVDGEGTATRTVTVAR